MNTEYRGFTIEPDYFGYKYYNTSYGVDCSYENDGWKSNVQHTETITSAQLEIDDILMQEEADLNWNAAISGFLK